MARKMKNSGIEWIGEIPIGWNKIKCKYISHFINGYAFESNVLNSDFIYPVIKIGDIKNGYIDYKNCQGVNSNAGLDDYQILENDILLAMSGATVGKVGISNKTSNSYINQRVGIIRSNNYKYLFYNLYTDKFMEYILLMANGSAQPNVSGTVYGNFYIPFPLFSEQQKIADYLDKKCSEIDMVIRKVKETIEEYKKLKQAVITQAVTKGIRDGREMKDSGIEWNNRIPAEWDSINPKALFRQRKDKAFGGEKQLTASQQHGIMFQSDYMELMGTKVVTVEKDFEILKHVEAGDFVISMRSFQGGLEYSEVSGSISSAYVMLIPNLELVYPRFYRWLLKSEVYIRALQSTSNMVRDGQAMRYSNFSQVRLYIVPMEEQKEIAQYLDEKCKIIDNLIAKKEQYLSEIENYKKSLIYEYVTGKKEVPCESVD